MIGIIAGAIIGGYILDNIVNNNDNFDNNENIKTCYLKNSNDNNIKTSITKILNNKIIPKYKVFYIGKTGSTTNRANSHCATKYNKIYLLCKSTNKENISDLESYYNGKYLSHDKNKNKKRGSAGNLSDNDSNYYLYVAVLEYKKTKKQVKK